MNYSKTIVTEPRKLIGATEEIVTGVGAGDSVFISLVDYVPKALNFEAPVAPSVMVRNNFFIDQQHKGLFSVVNEGEDLILTIRTSVVTTQDETVTWTITNGCALPSILVSDPTATEGVINYSTDVHSHSIDADFTTLTGTATILAGTDTITVNISTVDDVTFTGGENIYKVFTLTLSAPTNAMLIATNNEVTFGLLQDMGNKPTLSGTVNVWVKMHELLPFEPLMDTTGTSQAHFTLGLDPEQPEETNSNLRTLIIDDTPIVELMFVPESVEDVDGVVDISGGGVYFQVVIQSGRR